MPLGLRAGSGLGGKGQEKAVGTARKAPVCSSQASNNHAQKATRCTKSSTKALRDIRRQQLDTSSHSSVLLGKSQKTHEQPESIIEATLLSWVPPIQSALTSSAVSTAATQDVSLAEATSTPARLASSGGGDNPFPPPGTASRDLNRTASLLGKTDIPVGYRGLLRPK
ncbi:hypothetical protein VC83_08217 [Pseudogymnoascus destructans]|uniref:Uncharacterized protein n=1 Tax=Pseudogymnoascus destructans TaxID=655981 RepID=A0A177A2V1_9PEZI|nr:uncharacterized protein VC83_08217 [Pseudogymnoascus destructans]OAF55264.1 hypothetical protein VC83_08217 [Pseudogymnoascus destructans]